MERLLTTQQLSDLLQISPRTVYQWTHTGFIPHYKLPGSVRFKESEIEKWLKSRKRKGRTSYKIDINKICNLL